MGGSEKEANQATAHCERTPRKVSLEKLEQAHNKKTQRHAP